MENKKLVRKHFVDFDWTKMKSERIRIHGDYHLGQILVNNDDFYILDFEGEPESTIRDRKVKQPPLKDVAGLFRSFHYAIYATIFNNKDNRIISIGYNGMPAGWDNTCEDKIYCDDGDWSEQQLPKDANIWKKYKLKTKDEVIHAEANAILKLALLS